MCASTTEGIEVKLHTFLIFHGTRGTGSKSVCFYTVWCLCFDAPTLFTLRPCASIELAKCECLSVWDLCFVSTQKPSHRLRWRTSPRGASQTSMSLTVPKRQNWICVAYVGCSHEAVWMLDPPHRILCRYTVTVNCCCYKCNHCETYVTSCGDCLLLASYARHLACMGDKRNK
jgi:hypothetical protein